VGPAALLDACVLYPVGLRDTLLSVAQAGAFRPLWSAQIIAETRGAIVTLVSGVDPARIDRMLADMQAAFPDAAVSGYERLVGDMANHSSDRHVLAAAVRGRATVIVTWNVKHFPRRACAPHGVRVQTPDQFLTGLWSEAPEAVLEALEKQSKRYTAPPISVDEMLRRHEARLPRFVAAVRAATSASSPSTQPDT
jgi:predicted nucleic acid-binding protein